MEGKDEWDLDKTFTLTYNFLKESTSRILEVIEEGQEEAEEDFDRNG